MSNKKTFYLADGKTFANLKKFAKELGDMPQEVYSFHVNKEKNDFANWIKHSLSKEELAEKVEGHVQKVRMELEVLRHLIFEEENKAKKKAAAKPKAMPVKKKEEKASPAKKTEKKVTKKAAKPKAAPKKVAVKKAPAKKKVTKSTATVKKSNSKK